MSVLKITLELNTVTEANALTHALQTFLDCNEERHAEELKEHAHAQAHGKPVDWRVKRDTKELGLHLEACKDLLRRIEGP